MRRSLVIGGGGFLGKAIIRQLLSRGEEVTSFSRHSYPALTRLGVRQVIGDIRNPGAVCRACKKTDVVFHAAAKAGVWGSSREYFDINFHGTEHVIDACKKEGVSRLIYTSSPSVVFNGKDMKGVNESIPYPKTYHAPYPASKALAEKAVMGAASETLAVLSLRPHLIWGPEDNHLVPRILSRAKQLRIVGSGDNIVDTTYIDNAALAHIQAANRLSETPALSGRVYFISQGAPERLWDMVNAILAAGGLPPVTRHIPYKAAWGTGAVLEGLYRLFQIRKEPRMTRFVANELATSHWFDIGAAREELEYTPQVSTQEGLMRLADWLQNKNFRTP